MVKNKLAFFTFLLPLRALPQAFWHINCLYFKSDVVGQPFGIQVYALAQVTILRFIYLQQHQLHAIKLQKLIKFVVNK